MTSDAPFAHRLPGWYLFSQSLSVTAMDQDETVRKGAAALGAQRTPSERHRSATIEVPERAKTAAPFRSICLAHNAYALTEGNDTGTTAIDD